MTAPHEPAQCHVCQAGLQADGLCLACLLQEGLEAREASSAQGHAAPTRILTLPCEFAGYRLVREIASGGMGIVYEAEDVKLKRVVALKVVRNAHFATREEAARFRSETQAIAQLDHPDIVPIYESGEQDGMPYFTMRLAEGGSLADRLKKRGMLPDREAASFMSRIARAVQYAHEHGVLHRDLKPANILLDVSGRPMLSDFGLAKLLDAEFQLTRSHAHVGTPHYMSPEQAAGKAKQVTTASDVWALGVMLFQMLTDKLPFTGGSAVEVMRRITQEEPELSSTGRLSVRKEPKAGEVTSFKTPAGPLTQLQRDLATLILRCLEKQPERRLSSAGFLADELDRFLAGEPIQSRSVGATERLWKLARRHKAAAAAVLGISFSLVGGTVVSVYQAVKALAAERVALKQKKEAGTVADIVLNTVHDLDKRYTGRDIDPVEMKQQMLKRIVDFDGDPVRKARLLCETAAMFPNKQCLENYRLALALVEPVLAPDDPMLWHMRFNVAGQRAVMEDSSDECMRDLRGVMDWQRRHLGPKNDSTLFTMFTLAKNLNLRGDTREAEVLLAELCPAVEESHDASLSHQALCRLELTHAVFLNGRQDEALALGREHIRKALAQLGDKHVMTARTIGRHSSHCQMAGLLDEAETAGRQALEIFYNSVGPDNMYAKDCLTDLSAVLKRKGEKQARLALVKEAVQMCDLQLGPAHAYTLYRVECCMFVQNAMLQYDEALEMGEHWLQRIRSSKGDVPVEALGMMHELAYTLRMRREYERAETLLREILLMMERHDPDNPRRLTDLSNLAAVLLGQKRAEEAVPLLRQAVQSMEESGNDTRVLPVAKKRLLEAEAALSAAANAVR